MTSTLDQVKIQEGLSSHQEGSLGVQCCSHAGQAAQLFVATVCCAMKFIFCTFLGLFSPMLTSLFPLEKQIFF